MQPQKRSQSVRLDLWAGLENYVLEHARVHRSKLSVCTGPVFDPADPVYRDIAIPRIYWKIAVWVHVPDTADLNDANDSLKGLVLAATGYILDQTSQLDNIDLTTARALAAGDTPPLGPFRTFQAPISDIGALSGLHLHQIIEADRLSPPTGPSQGHANRARWLPLETPEEITL